MTADGAFDCDALRENNDLKLEAFRTLAADDDVTLSFGELLDANTSVFVFSESANFSMLK